MKALHSEEYRDGHNKAGWIGTLDKLAAYLDTPSGLHT